MAIALMAIVALPLCLPHEVAHGLDADERTITESRDVVEIVTTPGVHLLHQEADAQIADACNDCASAGGYGANLDGGSALHTDDPRVPKEDLGPRVAVMPPAGAVAGPALGSGLAHSDPSHPEAGPSCDPPPPRRMATTT